MFQIDVRPLYVVKSLVTNIKINACFNILSTKKKIKNHHHHITTENAELCVCVLLSSVWCWSFLIALQTAQYEYMNAQKCYQRLIRIAEMLSEVWHGFLVVLISYAVVWTC